MKRIIIGAVVVFLIATITVSYFLVNQSRANQPKPIRIKIDNAIITVELATTEAQQVKGLSGRNSLPPDHGMLFVFSSEDEYGFWMIDMKFSLDIIWFNSARQIVYIKQGLQPCTPNNCPIYTPSAKAMYVLEVNAGFVAAHNISPGDVFNFVTN